MTEPYSPIEAGIALNQEAAAETPPLPPPSPGETPSPLLWIAPAVLAAACFAVYREVASLDFLAIGDAQGITARDAIRIGLNRETLAAALLQPGEGGWQPLTALSHALVITLFGSGPMAHHVMNGLLHALASVLVFRFIARASDSALAGLTAALLFALHPLQVENVAWISGRAAIVSAIMATLVAGRYLNASATARDYRTGALIFVLGMLFNPWLGVIAFVLIPAARWLGLAVPGGRLIALALPFLVIATAVMMLFGATASIARFELGWLRNLVLPTTVPVAPMGAGAWGPPVAGALIAVTLVLSAAVLPALRRALGRVCNGLCMIGLVIAASFGWIAAQQVPFWKTDIVLYRHLLEQRGPSAAIYLGLGRGYNHYGLFAEAAAAFEKAGELNPGNRRAWLLLGAVHANMGAGYPARAAYQRALDLDPDDLGTRMVLDRIDEDIAEVEDRIAELEETVRSSPPTAWAPVIELGRTYSLMGRGQDTLALYSERLPAPEAARILTIVYAEAYARAGMPAEAAELYRRAAEDSPEPGEFRHELARQLYRAGDEAAARREVETLLEIDPEDARALRMKRALGW